MFGGLAFEDAERGIGVPTIAVPDSGAPGISGDLGLVEKLSQAGSPASRLVCSGSLAIRGLAWAWASAASAASASLGLGFETPRQLLFIPGLVVCLVAPSTDSLL